MRNLKNSLKFTIKWYHSLNMTLMIEFVEIWRLKCPVPAKMVSPVSTQMVRPVSAKIVRLVSSQMARLLSAQMVRSVSTQMVRLVSKACQPVYVASQAAVKSQKQLREEADSPEDTPKAKKMLWTRLEYCKLLKLVLWVQPTLEQPQNINLKVVDWQCIAETKIFGERTAITIETNLERIIFLTLFSNINGTMDSPGPETRRSIRATKKFGDMPTCGFLSWS